MSLGVITTNEWFVYRIKDEDIWVVSTTDTSLTGVFWTVCGGVNPPPLEVLSVKYLAYYPCRVGPKFFVCLG